MICGVFAGNTRKHSDEGKCGIEQNQRVHDDEALVLATEEDFNEPRGGKGRPQAAENAQHVADKVSTRKAIRLANTLTE